MELMVAASAEFERVVRLLPPAAWARPTPSQVTVRELVEHVVAGNRFAALLVAGAGLAAAKAPLQTDQLGEDPLAAVVESAARQVSDGAGMSDHALVAEAINGSDPSPSR